MNDVLDDDWERFKRIIQLGETDNACTPTATVVQTLQSEMLTDAYSHSRSSPFSKSDAQLSDSSTCSYASSSETPKCGPIYISTTTKIAHLNSEIDIKRVFWEIPVIRYVEQAEGVIKKQIKFSTTDRGEYEEIMERISKERCCDNQEIEHIDNPDGRIKFKDQRKISIGISKKDILCYRSKKKRAFFNCFVIIIRILSQDGANLQSSQQQQQQQQQQEPEFKEMHVKIFNTGKLEIPGIQNVETLEYVLSIVTRILKSAVSPTLSYMPGECETVLINSNFNCGFYIDRDRLHEILKYKYRINSNYDSCSYPGIQSKFYYVYGNAVQNGQQPHYYKDKEKDGKEKENGVAKYCEISFMIFRTGSVLIVGKCTENILHVIYNFLKTVLEDEYDQIVNRDRECGEDGQIPEWTPCPKKAQTAKIQRRVITCSEVHGDGTISK
jgi:hypothetical protein